MSSGGGEVGGAGTNRLTNVLAFRRHSTELERTKFRVDEY